MFARKACLDNLILALKLRLPGVMAKTVGLDSTLIILNSSSLSYWCDF